MNARIMKTIKRRTVQIQTISMRFVLNFTIFSAFYFAMCECVFLDNSQDNCIGVIVKRNVSAPYWTEYANITDSYSCLKTCLQKHERAEIAAYGPMQCFCSHLSYSKLHLDQNNAGCPSNGIAAISQLRVYNMSGFTLRVHFEKYIQQNLEFKANFEALLYYNGTTTNDSKILKDVLSSITCEVITTQNQKETRTQCLKVFRFNLLGENQICLRTGKTSGFCKYVMVLAPVSIGKIDVHIKSNGAVLLSKIRGTVYNLSFHLDNKLVESYAFAQDGKNVFEICEIRWKLWQRAVIVDGDKKLVVRASNPLNPSGVVKEKSFEYFFAIHLEVSYAFDVMTDEIEITVEAKGGVTAELNDLNYEWSFSGDCPNGSIYLLDSKTTVPKVKAITPYNPNFNPNRLLTNCRIKFMPVGKSGHRYSPKFRQLFYGTFNPGVLEAYAIVSRNYFLRGKEATFVVKRSKWSSGLPSYSWKVNNGTVMPSGPNFTHTFNETGSYTISVDVHVIGGQSRKPAALKDITVLEILTELKIVVTSFRYFGKPVSMRAIVNCFENVVYYWNFGDGKHYNTTSNVVEHLYSKAGIYNVQVVANNNFSEITANVTVNETELCPDGEFETSFEDGKEVKQFRSRSIHLEVSEKKLFCFKPVTIIFKWTISRWIDELNKWRDSEKQTSNKSTDSIYIPPNKLDYGKYRFNVTVNITDFVVFYTKSFSTIINVIESPVSAIIRGGKNRFVIENSTFFLDATPSFDPDNLNASLRFRWLLPNGKTFDKALISYNAAELNESGEFKVTVWSGKRKKEAKQHITTIDSKEIKTNIVLDCPSCDMEQLNPSKATRIMEKRISDCCYSNKKKDLWNLYESNVKYGKPKLEEIHCTASDQTSLPYTNGTSSSRVTYKFEKCDHANARHRTKREVKDTLRESQLLFKRNEPHSELLHIKKNYFPGNRSFIIRRVPERSSAGVILAERSFHVQDRPKDHSCAIHPTDKGIELLQDFEIKCNVDKNAHLIYKVLFKRAKADGISNVLNIFFQRKVPQFKFHLPSGYQDKNYLIISIESENGVTREYCSIDMIVKPLVAGFNAIKNVEEYLYNRSVAVNQWFSGHPYAYHGQTLYNITLISDVLNRFVLLVGFTVMFFTLNSGISSNVWTTMLHDSDQMILNCLCPLPNSRPTSTSMTVPLFGVDLHFDIQPTTANLTLLHLRTQIREMLISILQRVIVSNEYVSRQFASSLESCTRVTGELTNNSVVAVVEMLYNLMRRERHDNELSSEMDDNFQENILTVANSIKAKIDNKEYELKLLESVNYLFEDSMRPEFARTPLEITNFTQDTFKASITKFSPYCDQSIVFNWGKTRVMIKTRGDQDSNKEYDCDLFGCGLQGVTMEIDPFRDNDTYQTVSSLTKLKTQNCKQMGNCGEKITEVKMDFPIRFNNNTVQSAIYRLSSDERHIFTLERNVDAVLNMELVPIGSLSKKLRLRVGIRCAEMKYRVASDMSYSIREERLQQFFSPKNFSKKCKFLNVVVDIQWEVEPTKYESQQTEVMYNLHMRTLDCLTKKPDNQQWSENSCKCEIYHSHAVRLLGCSCPKLKGSDYSYVVVAKTMQSSLKEIVLDRERNKIVKTVMLVLSLCYAAVALVLFVKERQQYKNNNAIPLERCDPSHTHKYKITVYTGHCCGADTTAKVALVLYGDNNSSYPVELFTKSHALFQRNSRDVFVVSVRENLGSLYCIHLWHDNSGSSPSWFVDKLIIKDLSTNEKWMFKCSRWLAVDKNDGMLDCKIKPSNPKHKFTFKEFQLALGKNLMDFHIWLSLIRMPMFSLFTRAERLTCCMALLFGYLYFNAYFCYHYKEFIVDCLSVFNPTMSLFKVGVYVTLTCLPIYFFFAVMFRHTKSFIWLQPVKSGKVVPASVTHPTVREPCAVEKCEKVVPKIDGSSEDVRRRKQLELAALLVKSMGDEDDPASDEENMCSDEDSSTETTAIAPTNVSSRSPVIVSQNHKNIEHELASDSSRSSLLLARPTSLRFPMCFNVLMWIGCIVTFLLSSQFTVEYVSRLDDATLRCYTQSVFWSLFISMFISQPFQALFVTVFQVLHGFFYSTIIDEPTQEIEEDVVPDDSMFASFTEKNFEDPLYRKLFCIKYLKPLSKKAVTRARYKLQKQNTTVIVFRDVLMYCLLLVFLYLLNPFWDQKSIFLHNKGLKTFFNRQVNTSSLLAWWSSSPQTFLDTLTFDNKTLTMKAFQNKDLLIGNPEVRMVFKYCQVNNTYQINGTVANATKRDCTKNVEEKVLHFGESQKKNWLGLTRSINENFNEHVTDISLKFVIFIPPLAVFSVVKMSSHIIAPSPRVQSDVAIMTVGFHVDRSMTLSLQTICQLLFTVVPVLLLIRQLYSSIENKKRAVLGVSVELMIVFLSLVSVILMWIWIKYQYFTLGILLQHQYEANIVNDLQTIYKYQEAFKCCIAFMLFSVSIKVCHVIGLDKLLNCQVETFTSVLGSVLFPLFALLVVFVGFAHMGVLLFGDHLKMYETFVQALSQNVIFLRKTGAENLMANTPYQQMLLAVYVIAFCVCMILFFNLVKAAFCQSRINYLLSMKRKRIPIKEGFFKKVRGVFSLIWSYREEPNEEDDTLKRVPMSYIFKELDEQLNDLEFRLTHLTCKANMPAKAVTDRGSSSNCTDVEYVYKGDNERPSYSSFQRDLSSSKSSHFEFPTEQTIAEPNMESSESGSMTTHAETVISNTTKRRRPFQRTMRAFPAPMNETLKSSEYSHVLLDPWLGENDCAKSEHIAMVYLKHQTTADEEVSLEECEDKENIAIEEMSVDASTVAKEPKSNYAKKNRGGLKRPQVVVNDFTNNVCEGDEEDCYGYSKRSNVRLNAFEDEPSPIASDNEDCSPSILKPFQQSVDISLERQYDEETIVDEAGNKLDSTSEKKKHACRQRSFRQPTFPLTINHVVSSSSEI